MAVKFSIRYKFLSVTTLLLIVCVGAYLLIATDAFRSDKRDLVFDYNSNLVSNISSDIDNFFQSIGDKMTLSAMFALKQQSQNQKLIESLLQQNSDIVYLAVSDRFESLNREVFENKVFSETYALGTQFYSSEIIQARPIPFQTIQVSGQAIWNATTVNGPPLIGYGKSVIEENSKGVPIKQFAVIGFINASKISESLSRSKLNEVFVTNGKGEILVHSKHQKMLDKDSKDKSLIGMALSSPVRTQVKSFEDGQRKMMGAFSKSFKDQIFVMSQVSEEKAFAAVNRLVYRSIFFALIPLTMAFIVAILFSRSLTHPIEVLVGGMKKVSKGDLNTRIKVNSHDEISSLADSFNSMISDLRQSRAELEEINRDLENKVRARTKQLEEQNQAVKQAQEALLRTTRLAAVGEIAGQAAHEVLNPLTSIISRIKKVQNRLELHKNNETNLLKEIREAWSEEYNSGGFSKLESSWKKASTIKKGASLWDEDMENLKAIEESTTKEFSSLVSDAEFLMQESQRINRIVNSMRSMSKVKTNVTEKPGNELVQKSVKIMADLASQYNINLELSLNAQPDTIYIDEDEFIQIMTNILRNSLQAINMREEQKEQGLISISSKIERGLFEVHITDNGVGISDENRKRLFEKHFTTKSAEGTGIGLSISRRLIRAFKGNIDLKKSEIGKGSTFVVSLPLQKSSGRASA